MRIGSKLVTGYVLLLGLMGALVFFGISGEQRLSKNYDALVRLSQLESSIAMVHKASLSGAGHEALLALSAELAKELKEFDVKKNSNEAAVIRRAQLANMGYKEKLEALKTLEAGINRYIQLSKENVQNIAEDVERIAGIIAEQNVSLLSVSSLEAQKKRNARLKSMQTSIQNVQVALRLMEATNTKKDYDTAKENAELLLENCTALRNSMKAMDLLVLDRAIVAAKNLNTDFIQLGQLYNRAFEVDTDIGSGLSNVNVAIRQLADSQRDKLAFVRESSIIPGVAIVAGAVIVALISYLLMVRATGSFVSRVEQATAGLMSGDRPPSFSTVRGMSPVEVALWDAWSNVTEQTRALEKIAVGEPVTDLENNLGLDALSRAIGDVEVSRREVERSLRQCLESVNIPASGNASDMLQALKTCVYDSSTSLASITEKVQELRESGFKLEKGITQATKQSEQAFATLHRVNTFSELSSAVSSALDALVTPKGLPVSTIAELKSQFSEIERAVKVIGWQVASYEDVARHLETLAINVNVEAARIGADTTAMGTIVDEIRGLSEKCRHAAEASDNGKTLGSRALDRVFNGLSTLEKQDKPDVATVDSDTVKRAAQVLSQLENVELALTAIFTKAGVTCSQFVSETEALVSVVENASVTSAKLSQEFAEPSASDTNSFLGQEPIELTDQVIEFEDDAFSLPKLDL
ncbi:hypothetical protein [Halodesulfovibrio marinisediminis]|uniref:Methyl-accepting transducer domain-containing protein n=1 Tax=Halodesulfovibrio marinisediminis DSM 17456 TaxID=1121457 RepID=A0A1N6DRV1_9BACT|nr:hypothetical protein [Halodesulfovibrio marinisediminis]SIN73423.1 hypothetical protein SAMN02745161_0427 [Halodesulfovibrio marinisediminis DSM 17456]